MSIEKITNPLKTRHWLGNMEAHYVYTLGVAGERFFKELKENGRIMGAKCPRCGIVYVPPRMYCEKCFAKLEEWVDVGRKGVIHTFTIATLDIDGKKLEKPEIYALIKFEGAHGGIIHKIGETDTVFIGMKVEAVLKPFEERKASINDIAYFRPVK
ncbi:Zn-ribbon domain-containing OB-fold protein [Candidatus Bathyarchaeota archaeon]|nr:MAG: Zn-ribbon domain-containing OB-fold protein [Candidatus Bathyarchaeota archaeon]RJS82654.1 MAG: Zn-ribbon domain-containing OB-fold protein [Candidatus Bathyarchaeota archaeon]